MCPGRSHGSTSRLMTPCGGSSSSLGENSHPNFTACTLLQNGKQREAKDLQRFHTSQREFWQWASSFLPSNRIQNLAMDLGTVGDREWPRLIVKFKGKQEQMFSHCILGLFWAISFCIPTPYLAFECCWALRRVYNCAGCSFPLAVSEKLEQGPGYRQFRFANLPCSPLHLSMSEFHQLLCCQFAWFCSHEVHHSLLFGR